MYYFANILQKYIIFLLHKTIVLGQKESSDPVNIISFFDGLILFLNIFSKSSEAA